MSSSNLLDLVRKYQDKNKETDVYYSRSTCIKLLNNEIPEDVFIITFGKKVKPPKGVLHKHISTRASNFVSYQPFKLDTILISVKDNTIVDVFNAKDDIDNCVIQTVKDSGLVLKERPFLAIRVAALMAETGFTPDKELVTASSEAAEKLNTVDGKIIWREFKRILRAEKPSLGITFLHDTGVLKIILPELEDCYGVEQNVKYHKHTVFEHCLLACDSCDNSDVRLRFAALIHDIGKPPTKSKNETGITFHKHEVFSTRMARKVVIRFRLKKNDAAFIVGLVQNHMYQYDRAWKDSTVKKFIRRVGLDKRFLGDLQQFPLFKLRNADRMGRGLPPVTQKQKDFEERLDKMLSNWGERNL